MNYAEFRSRLQKELDQWNITQERFDNLNEWIDIIEGN